MKTIAFIIAQFVAIAPAFAHIGHGLHGHADQVLAGSVILSIFGALVIGAIINLIKGPKQ